MFRKLFALALLFAFSTLPALANGNKLDTIGAFADPGASDSIKKSLEEKGHRVSLGDGTALCDIWLRKAVPTRNKTDVSGAIYTEIADSAIVGVVSFPKTSLDFRGQEIKAGSYTLRYALHPTDGNHMGISPYRDFLLLVPVALDQNADATYKFEELVKLSANTNGTKHPAPFSLVANESKSDVPVLTENEHGHTVFNAKVKTTGGATIPIAFVVKGQAEQ